MSTYLDLPTTGYARVEERSSGEVHLARRMERSGWDVILVVLTAGSRRSRKRLMLRPPIFDGRYLVMDVKPGPSLGTTAGGSSAGLFLKPRAGVTKKRVSRKKAGPK